MNVLTPNMDRAVKAYGDDIPKWVEAMAKECDKHDQSQEKVGRSLGVSGAMVCQVLGNSYKGSITKISTAAVAKLLSHIQLCPAQGEISTEQCFNNAQNTHLRTNPIRVALARACPTCPLNPLKGDKL